MDNETLEFVQVLKLPSVELWDFKDHHLTLLNKGPLEVLFNKDLGLALLKLHHFKYALVRWLQIVGSSDNDLLFRSYLLPNADNCYLLKVCVPSSDPSAVNLETIFESSCQLARNPNLEAQLKSYQDKGGFLSRGESFIKESFIKGSDVVSEGIAAVTSKIHPMNPNHMLIKRMDELKLTNKDQSTAETFTRIEIFELMEIGNDSSKRQDSGFWNNLNEGSMEISPEKKPEETQETKKEDDKILKREDELTDLSKLPNLPTDEKTRLQKLSENGHTLIHQAKEGLHHITSKISRTGESVEDKLEEGTQQTNKEDDKVLKREDELTDISKLPNLPTDEKTRMEKLSENGHALIDRAKEGLHNITSKITGTHEIKEEDKILLREDQLTDISQLPYLPIEKTTMEKLTQKTQDIIDSTKGTLSNLTSKISGSTEKIEEQASQKEDEFKDKMKQEENHEGTKEFREVTEGFSENIIETKKEEVEEMKKELHSNNPFQLLGNEEINVAQPLSNAEIVGGDIQELTTGVDVANIDIKQLEGDLADGEGEDRSLMQKVKEGISDVSSKLSDKFNKTKEKIKSTFASDSKSPSKGTENKSGIVKLVDKENAPVA